MEILTTNRQNVPTMSRWQADLKSAFRNVESLLEFLELEKADIPNLQAASSQFPILVPRSFADRMEKQNPLDPLLLQVVSSRVSTHPGDWSADPVKDSEFEAVAGVLRKYSGRALLVVTGACAIHCRYCFRQNFDYSKAAQHNWEQVMESIERDPSITEVILSGGDPLLLNDLNVANLIRRLNDIPQITRIRIHSRTPVVLPSRMTEELLGCLGESSKPIWMVLHINHPREIDTSVETVLERLHTAKTVLLNQAVLLHQVNADFETQRDLCTKLINNRVIPYYLHLLDHVKGSENYLTSDQAGIEIIEQLRTVLPGYGVPKLVKEVAGQPSKTVIR